LFLKHHFGVGYTLNFDADIPFDVASVVETAKDLSIDKPGSFQWQLDHGYESKFSEVLAALSNGGATNVSLELTTLEQVFIQTGKEDEDERTSGDDEQDGDDEVMPNNDEEDKGDANDSDVDENERTRMPTKRILTTKKITTKKTTTARTMRPETKWAKKMLLIQMMGTLLFDG